ncbi:MAG: hypothetical protein Pars2KO_23990 [Parasphingorhabdus sp.]
MSAKRSILVETALVTAVLATGITASHAVHATPTSAALQAAADPRSNVKIESLAQVERTEKDTNDNDVTKLYSPADVKVIPGDRLVFTNSYRNTGAVPVTGFVVNNPIHPAVSFTAVTEDWALVSVDGGKSFGKLVDLTVPSQPSEPEDNVAVEGNVTPALTTRAAQPSDVTHIRWAFSKAIAAGASGKLQFRGIVK